MRGLFQDFRYGFRSLAKDKSSVVVAVLTLALGIGLCTTVFSLVYGVFGRGPDVPEAGRIRLISRINLTRGDSRMSVSQHEFYDWRERQRTFEGLASITGGGTVNLSDSARGPERYEGSFVSANVFDLLRVAPVLGSTFRPGDDGPGAPLTLVLGYQVWKTRYGANSNIAGTHTKANGEDATILGVMPPGFMFPTDAQLWLPQRDERARTPNRRGGVGFDVIGRLKDGVSLDHAQADMARVTADLAKEYPETNKDIGARFQTIIENNTGPEILAVFGGMQVATLFVLLIACANVANLLLARATMKTKEAAVRTAIGASRLRVVRPFFAETVILSTAGALLGTGIAAVGIGLFDQATSNVGKPYYMLFKLDLPVLAFVVGLTVLTAFAAGIAPAIQVLKTDLHTTLKDESRGSSGVLGGRLSKVLVVAEIALSCALLVGAGLMTKSIVKLKNYDFPFATENVFTARVGLFETMYPDTTVRRQFWASLLERLQRMPGAAAAALTTRLPGGGGGGNQVMIEGATYAADRDYPRGSGSDVTQGFFETFDVRMVEGREFSAQDVAGSLPVIIINKEFAQRHFKGVSPLGRRIREGTSQSTAPWRTIVGVAPNLIVKGIDADVIDISAYYVPVAQRNDRFLSIAVRATRGNGLTLAPQVQSLVRALDPDLPIYEVRSMLGSIKQETWFFNVFGTVFVVFGAAALFMASVGLYGVLAFSVSRRVREMGIRMALGASARDVLGLILRQGATQIAIGLVFGLALAFGLSRAIKVIMFDVEPNDPVVFGAIVLVVSVVGLLASWVPAKRATAVAPNEALRYE